MTGILFATREEADPFLTQTGAVPAGDTQHEVFLVTGPGGEEQLRVLITGIGPVAGRGGALHLIEKHGAGLLINVGLCAALNEGVAVGSVFRITEATPLAVNDDPESQEALWFPCIPAAWESLSPARLVTSAEAVFGGERRARASRRGELVDMEGAAIAEVGSERSVPNVLLKGVSDFAGATDRRRLHENLPRVAGILAEILMHGLGIVPDARGAE